MTTSTKHGAGDVEPQQIRIAVIGFGARAPISRFAELEPGVKITHVVDPDVQAWARAVDCLGPGVQILPSLDDLLEGDLVDAAFVMTPDDTHEEIATRLLRSGIATYLEKPIATTVGGADAVLEAATASGAPLYVGHNMRHMPVVTTMQKIIERGDIGDVVAIWCRHFVGNGGDFYFKDWHAERSRSNGLLLQKGVHDIDVIHLLGGAPSRQVVAMGDLMVYDQVTDRADNSGRSMPDWLNVDNWPPLSQSSLNPVIDVEDVSMMLMRLDNGVLASYQQCHFTPDYWRNYTVIGTEGRLENFGDTDGGEVRVWRSRSMTMAPPDDVHPIHGDTEGHEQADIAAIADFIRLIRTGESALSPVAARDAVATADMATRSLREGSQPQLVPKLDPPLADYFSGSSGSGGNRRLPPPLATSVSPA